VTLCFLTLCASVGSEEVSAPVSLSCCFSQSRKGIFVIIMLPCHYHVTLSLSCYPVTQHGECNRQGLGHNRTQTFNYYLFIY